MSQPVYPRAKGECRYLLLTLYKSQLQLSQACNCKIRDVETTGETRDIVTGKEVLDKTSKAWATQPSIHKCNNKLRMFYRARETIGGTKTQPKK